MWVFAPDGSFYSVVQKPADRKKNTLTIRTRNRGDIDALIADYLPDAKPYQVRYSDYEWRVRVPKAAWAKAVQQMALSVSYRNYKDEVTKRQGWDRHDVYLKVWQALLRISDRPRRSWKYRDDEFEPTFEQPSLEL